jgi:hypothetical protein
MSETKLRKYLEKQAREPICVNKRLISTPAILADSKGNSLKRSGCESLDGRPIKWWCKSGARTRDQLNWLKKNIGNKIAQYGNLTIFVWLGTCDLTVKEGKYISLRQGSDKIVEDVEQSYREIQEVVKTHDKLKIVFLEVPVYSIEEWNKKKGHKTPELFR